jgi:hypothetical protein
MNNFSEYRLDPGFGQFGIGDIGYDGMYEIFKEILTDIVYQYCLLCN